MSLAGGTPALQLRQHAADTQKRISSTVIVFCLLLQIFALKVDLEVNHGGLGKEFDPMSQYMAQMCPKQCQQLLARRRGGCSTAPGDFIVIRPMN